MKKMYLFISIALLSLLNISCEKQEDNDSVRNLKIRAYSDGGSEAELHSITFVSNGNGVREYVWGFKYPNDEHSVVFDTINGSKVVATFDTISSDYTITCRARGVVDEKTVELRDFWNVVKQKSEVDFITYGDSYKKGKYKGIRFIPNSMFSVSYLWDFGDNKTSSSDKPTHLYGVLSDTTYTVTCEIRAVIDTLT
jgi:hypothetical protein